MLPSLAFGSVEGRMAANERAEENKVDEGEESEEIIEHQDTEDEAPEVNHEEEPAAGADQDAGKAEKAKEIAKGNELEKGKNEYNKGNYKDAIKSWQASMRSVKYINEKGLYKDKPEQMAEVNAMELKLHINMAQGYLKMEEWNQAVESATKALDMDEKNPKALYRKAYAQMQLMCFTEAQVSLEKLLKVEPENAAAKSMLAEAKHKEIKGERDSKKLGKQMMKGIIKEKDPNAPVEVKTAWIVILSQALEQIQAAVLAFIAAIMRPVNMLLEGLGLADKDKQD